MKTDKLRGNVENALTKLFFVLCLMISGTGFACGIVFTGSPLQIILPLTLFVLLCSFALAALLHRLKDHIDKRKFLLILALVFAVLLSMQMIAAYYLRVIPSWDFGGVYTSAREYLETGYNKTFCNYYDGYPNNCGIFLLEYYFFKLLALFGVKIEVAWGIALNIVFIDMAVLFAVLFVRKLGGDIRALYVAISALFFMPYTLYAPIFYTDSLSMVFVTLALYIFACCVRQQKMKKQLILMTLFSVVIFLGTKMKGSVLILLVAAVIYLLLNLGIKRLACMAVAIAVPFFAFNLAFDAEVDRIGLFTESFEDFNFPTEYWIYMGLSDPGGFNPQDHAFFEENLGRENRQRIAREGIVRRINEYGVLGLVAHFVAKSAFTYNDGTYFIAVQLSRKPEKQTFLHEFFTAEGKYYEYFRSAVDAYHYAVLLLMIVGMALGIRKRGFDLICMLYCTVLGLSIFLMIWETRSRYLLNFTPLYLTLAADTMFQIFDFVSKKIKFLQGVSTDSSAEGNLPDAARGKESAELPGQNVEGAQSGYTEPEDDKGDKVE